MIPILITAILSFMLGSIVGMFIGGMAVLLCQAGSERDNIYKEMDMIPITVAEPRLGSDCLAQVTGALAENITAIDTLLIAAYTDQGWVLQDYPEAGAFDVYAWCYMPKPIRRKV